MRPSPSTTSPERDDAAHLKTILSRIRLVAFDFDGVFTDNLVYVFQDGREAVRCSRADGIGLRALERLGISPVILSTEVNAVVAARAAKLRVPCRQGLADKLSTLKTLTDEMGLTLAQSAFVGNDVNDASCLQAVGIAIVVQDAHPAVVPLAHFCTETRGGYGAVREVCDWFASVLAESNPA